MGIIWGSIWEYFLKQGEKIAPIYLLWNRTVLQAYFWEIHKKIFPCLSLRRQLIRRGGFLPGAAGVLVRGGVGVKASTISPPHNPDLPTKLHNFRRSLNYESKTSGKYPD
jgi:hypothetical protein